MTIKSMYHFESATRFNRFTEYLEKINWKIEKQLLKERVLKYNEDELYVDLQNQFNKKNLTIWPLKDEETITWMDTLLIMRRTMTSLFKKGISSDKLHIFMEYPLVYGNHMRADYLIVYDRLIIVLEFGMFNQDEKRSEERYTKKLQDSITHRQVLANMMNDGVKTVNYVMIYRPEFDRIKNTDIKENIIYNNQEIDLLTKFIATHANEQDKLAAINQLELINIYQK